ncbi:hypothetical protein [Halolamina salifodinae]|uniref:DUF7969 domain-containing protein n=1 Tax=Halolamina salifodinae TaxID=1202767 RepID=A0A8T4GXF1_9EURY|nr:hypothetical protein [Halolamina salifodinae]MBP1987687.1 hypothetical protein [Halolamina salifodinae]
MPYPVTYYCPRCGAIHELEREGYLADKTVTPYPLEGWTYVDPDEPFEDEDDVDGVRIVCGVTGLRPGGERIAQRFVNDDDLLLSGDDLPEAADAPDSGCGEPFYLSFVRFEDGVEVEPEPEGDRVTIGVGPGGPRGPDSPGGPPGPGGD